MASDITNVLQAIHFLDLLLVALIGGLAVYGFVKGAANVAIILISTYLGFAIASIYYAPFARLINNVLNISLARVAEILAFFILNVLMAVLLGAVLRNILGNLQMPGRAGACIDRPAGMFLGFATGVVIGAIVVILLSVPFTKFAEIQNSGGQAPIFTMFHAFYQQSWLAPGLANLNPAMLSSIAPLTGQRLPTLITPSAALFGPLLLAKIKLQDDEVGATIAVK